jgi:hypothetical protein
MVEVTLHQRVAGRHHHRVIDDFMKGHALLSQTKENRGEGAAPTKSPGFL